MKKRIAILGATGSIGSSTMDVIRQHPDEFQAVYVSCGSRHEKLGGIVREFGCAYAGAPDLDALRPHLPAGTKAIADGEELCGLLASGEIDLVVCAVQGTNSIHPVLAALNAGIDVALASKEILVAAGNLVTRTAREHNARLLPVDSEHCAIFQCLQGHEPGTVKRIILTCSGGPFFLHPDTDFTQVTFAQTQKHPTWSMGQKITLDSATLMNKALEIIEAHWLFGLSAEQIHVTIHPQSIVHSMVEYIDGSVIAQMGTPDMRLPIQYCLGYPHRMANPGKFLDFTQTMKLEFLAPDDTRFPALNFARDVIRLGGTAGAIFNAANEAAIQRFMTGTTTFDQIPWLAKRALDSLEIKPADSLETILQAHEAAFNFVMNC